MAGSVGKTDALNNEPNVVPMIDVLLVLLIIFMIIVPISRKALDLQLPDPTPSESQGPPPSQIVLEVMPGNRYAINKEPVSREQLAGRLKEIYDPRPRQDHLRQG
jgi:biopolymer transport protein TolR